MKIQKQPSDVTITLSPKEFWLKKEGSGSDFAEYRLVYRINMDYAGKPDQEGETFMLLDSDLAKTFREAGFEEI